jgi:hypothetical protein
MGLFLYFIAGFLYILDDKGDWHFEGMEEA